jgi:hypothetical protein
MRHRKRIALGAVVVVGLAVVTGVARAGVSGGPAPDVEFKTGGAFSTPSGSYVTVTTSSFAAGGGVIAVQFSAAGWVQDWKSGGVFAGKDYAALRARVLVNGTPLGPGSVVLFDNTGKIGIKPPRPTSASFEWAGIVGAGATTVTVQVANLHAFDNAQLNHFTLTVQHN